MKNNIENTLKPSKVIELVAALVVIIVIVVITSKFTSTKTGNLGKKSGRSDSNLTVPIALGLVVAIRAITFIVYKAHNRDQPALPGPSEDSGKTENTGGYAFLKQHLIYLILVILSLVVVICVGCTNSNKFKFIKADELRGIGSIFPLENQILLQKDHLRTAVGTSNRDQIISLRDDSCKLLFADGFKNIEIDASCITMDISHKGSESNYTMVILPKDLDKMRSEQVKDQIIQQFKQRKTDAGHLFCYKPKESTDSLGIYQGDIKAFRDLKASRDLDQLSFTSVHQLKIENQEL